MLGQWRLSAGLTQRALGDRLKKPHTFVHKTETGDRRIDPLEFAMWCVECGINPGDAMNDLARWTRP